MVRIKQSNTNVWQNKYLNNFNDVTDIIDADYNSIPNANVDTTKHLPYQWVDAQPITTSSNQFERNNVPYRYDSDGIYVGDYKLNNTPIIVEREVIKEIYLTQTSPLTAALDIYHHMKGEVKSGKKLYRDDNGRVVSR